jgi:Flp pilus assembly protein TadG
MHRMSELLQSLRRRFSSLTSNDGSAILEFAISIPLLVVFIVGIFDFSAAFNQRQKLAQAAQEGAIVAGAQPNSDIYSGNANPDSLQPVVAAAFNSLAASGVLAKANQGSCKLPPGAPSYSGSGLSWTYNFTGCSDSLGDQLSITVNRGATVSSTQTAICSIVSVNYPYHWRFNSVIQLLIPGVTYAAITNLQESATVHNQT